MTREDKRLLLKDLCSRLPYGVNVEIDGYNISVLKGIDGDTISTDRGINYPPRIVKPYLRPMESMTEDERNELSKILNYEFYIDDDFGLVAEDDRHRIRLELCEDYIDWLNERHFDYRGLIPMGLALEAPDGMYLAERKEK